MLHKSVLLTGASGFLGVNLARHLLHLGHRPTLLVRPSSQTDPQLASRLELIRSPDWSEAGLRKALGHRRFDLIIHLAAYGVVPVKRDPVALHGINVQLPLDLLVLAQPMGASVILAGSSSEYSARAAANPLSEQMPLETQMSYGASKAEGGRRALRRATELEVPLCLLRFFNLFGPDEAPHRLLPTLLRGARESSRIALSPGHQLRDFVYVKDAIAAIITAAEYLYRSADRATAVAWNVCSGRGTSVRDFCEWVADVYLIDPALLGFGDIPMRQDDIPAIIGAPDKMRHDTGWETRYDIEDALRDMQFHTVTDSVCTKR